MTHSVIIGEAMKNYINSIHQKTGDAYYDKKNYNKALARYKLGLNALESEIAKDPEILTSASFCDQYVYAISDVLHTQSMIINRFVIDSEHVTTDKLLKSLPLYSSLLTTISHNVGFMNESWEFIRNEDKRETKPKQIRIVYTLLARDLELLSDLWSATADEVGRTHPNYDCLLNQSCTAMKLAIDAKSRLPDPAGVEMHCGYLNLLEQLYYFKHDEDFQEALLINMKKHLEEHQLLMMLQDDPITQLELISYALLVDVHLQHVPNTQLIAQGKNIVASITERTDVNKKIISDFENLAAQSARLPRQGGLSSSSTSISLPVSRKPQQQTRYEPARASSSSTSEIHQNTEADHPLRSVAQLIARNPERIAQMVDKLYSLGCGEFSRLYPESHIAFFVQNNTQSNVKHLVKETIELSEDTEQFKLLAPALEYIANHYLKQPSSHSHEVRRLFEQGKHWQKRAICLSLNIQTAIRSFPFSGQPKRTRIDSTPLRTLPSSSDSLPEIQVASAETNKRARNPGDSKTSRATNIDQLPHSYSEFLTHQNQALAQWNVVKHSDGLTLGQTNFANTNRGLFSQSGRETVPWLPLALDSSSDTEQFDWDTDPSLTLALDSRTDAELFLQDAVNGSIAPDFVSNLSFFASSSTHEPTLNGLNDSHPKVLAFIHAMKNIKSMDNQHSRLYKRLLANLLTVMGEFLEVDPNPDSPMKKFIAVVLTVESLYKMALVIYPGHEVANIRLQQLQDNNMKMLENRHHYVSLSDDLETQSDKKHFEDAIEIMMTDLEVLYSGKPESIATIINSLFKFMTETILKYKLMNTADLSDLMEQFHGHGAHPDVCSSSTHSLPFN